MTRAIEGLYADNSHALRADFSEARPATPVLYLDGTGSSIGKGLGHAEIGSADYQDGTKQSRRTLKPVAAWEGGDHRPDQAENLDIVFPSFNKAVAAATLYVEGRGEVPMRPITVGDMQGTKATYGMNLTSHSVWCLCGEAEQHCYPCEPVETYADMLAHYERVGCVLKTERQMCEWAHWPFEAHRGLRW